MDPKQIGARVVEARVRKGLVTPADLARRLTQRTVGGVLRPVSRETVRLWEVGDTIPPPDKLEQLAQLLGVTEEWLLFGRNNDEDGSPVRMQLEWLSPEEQALLTDFRRANETGQEEIAAHASRMAKRFPRPVADIRALASVKPGRR